MKSNKEILDEFGILVGEDAFDSQYGSLLQVMSGEGKKFSRLKPYAELFEKFSNEENELLKSYFRDLLGGILFDFLKIFEENSQFKIMYEESGRQIDLVEISEMLKGEPIIEGGWIDRFSQEIDK